jgi:hypothetical protein
MLISLPRTLWMALHCREDMINMSWWNWILFQLEYPPFTERFVGFDVEGLLWQQCLSKSIGYISSKDKEVFASSNSLE